MEVTGGRVPERGRTRRRKLRDTFSSSWQLILVPSSVYSIAKWNHPSLISPPLQFHSPPPLIRPPAYSSLPQLHSFPWKHRMKRVTSRLNQKEVPRILQDLLSCVCRVQDDTPVFFLEIVEMFLSPVLKHTVLCRSTALCSATVFGPITTSLRFNVELETSPHLA